MCKVLTRVQSYKLAKAYSEEVKARRKERDDHDLVFVMIIVIALIFFGIAHLK